MTDDVEARVRDVLVEVFGLDPADVGPGTSVDTVEAWDSLQHLTVVLSLEEEFDIAFDEDETVSIVTFDLIVMTVREKLG
jgi:acyl carrier protein